MFNNKTNTSIYFLFLFLFISFDLNAIDEFDYNLLSEKLNRLEQEISDIHKSLYSTNDNTLVKEDQKSVPLKYQRRINKMENDFAKMNGQFEEIFFRLGQLQEQLNRINSDVDFRLSTNKNVPSEEGLPLSKKDRSGEKDTYAYPKNTSDVNTVGGDVEILGTIEKKDNIDEPYEIAKNFQSPESLFNHGKDSLRNLNYENAEMAFRGFIKKYPKDDKVPSAYYWLGESLFVRENYPEAVLAYGEIIKNYKKHNKASASLLKIGISFSNLDKKKESCDALNKILKQYPNSERDILKKTNYIIQENNC